ncbi:MAG: PPOX class F420-dependent oxidoreductase [Chloroflexi bacterium]|nr:PPOX class F420-dependent oxidoreductase [Chloroflexota bacterium]
MADIKLPPKAVELLHKPFLAHVATVMRDGTPQVTPVWVDTDGEHILINTAEGRLKTRNLRRNPNVAVSIADPQNSLRGALQVRGKAIEITAEGANEHINKLSLKYNGRPYNYRSGEVRVIVKIRPERISGGITRE